MTKKIKISAVGDISFADFPFCPGFGIRSALSRGFSPFKNISEVFKGSDIVFGNLETVLSNNCLNPNSIRSWEMRGIPIGAELLREAGFNVINVANNHIMQHGLMAFNETVEKLNGQGVEVIGLTEEDLTTRAKPIILNCKGRSIGFLGYAFEDASRGNKELGYAFGPFCNLQEDIGALREKVNVLVVSCHWGLEFIYRPSPNTITLGRNLINWGADIVLGHHSHTLQGYEYYKNGVIVYSMGNFVFDMLWDDNFRISAIFVFKIDSKKVRLNIIPIFISGNYRPVVMNEEMSRLTKQKIEDLSNQIDLTIEGDLERKTLSYYLEYEKLRRKNRYKSYVYFLKNISRVDRRFLPQIITRTLKRRFGEISDFFGN